MNHLPTSLIQRKSRSRKRNLHRRNLSPEIQRNRSPGIRNLMSLIRRSLNPNYRRRIPNRMSLIRRSLNLNYRNSSGACHSRILSELRTRGYLQSVLRGGAGSIAEGT